MKQNIKEINPPSKKEFTKVSSFALFQAKCQVLMHASFFYINPAQ